MAPSLLDAPILLTGFPGFLANHLLRNLAGGTTAPIHLLCLPQTLDQARQQMEQLTRAYPALKGRWTLHSGDITLPNLGLSKESYASLSSTVGVVWHLAALYDLAVEEEIAYRVNMGGTRHILAFCEDCPNLLRLNYVSTCYVSGDRTGRIYEDELDLGQRHKNHYEATKFWAEVEVQRRSDHIPTTIFRPGITVGDSTTGEINKYDGPYYIFRLLHRLPEWVPFPNIGRGDATVNLVPVDFVARALAALGHRADTQGQVFHIADPNPMTARAIVDSILSLMGRAPAKGRVPAAWVERALEHKSVESLAKVPPEALAYFNHDAQYDTTQAAQALREEDIYCPHLSSYLGRLVDFYLRHPDAPPAQSVVDH